MHFLGETLSGDSAPFDIANLSVSALPMPVCIDLSSPLLPRDPAVVYVLHVPGVSLSDLRIPCGLCCLQNHLFWRGGTTSTTFFDAHASRSLTSIIAFYQAPGVYCRCLSYPKSTRQAEDGILRRSSRMAVMSACLLIPLVWCALAILPCLPFSRCMLLLHLARGARLAFDTGSPRLLEGSCMGLSSFDHTHYIIPLS